jgi:HTH-type transcriptional regulator / antitoxin HipB
MQIHTKLLHSLALRLNSERTTQGLSREQLASVCNVSPSFIRDAERDPGRCSLALLLQVTQGLGLTASINGWANDINAQGEPPTEGPPA